MKTAIITESLSGNTRLLAETIRSEIPASELIYAGSAADEALGAELIFIGSWTDKGLFSEPALAFLQQCHQKQLALFLTAGFGISDAYFEAIFERTEARIPSDNQILGHFACQGRMQPAVRERYLAQQQKEPENPRWAQMIANFDLAASHPDEDDLNRCRKFARMILSQTKQR